MKNAFAIALLFTACATKPAATPPCNAGLSLVNAALWVQSSAEYQASALQTFAAARRALDDAIARNGAQNGAVILDLDETAIQNLPFEGRVVRAGKTYDAKMWSEWVAESAATAVPGAQEFLLYARSRGVKPFYITNRKAEEEAATRRNLEALGFPLDAAEDNVLTRGERPEWSSSDKTPRRDFVASRYRVLLLAGDDLNDFVDAHDKSVTERSNLIHNNAAKWGTMWFVVPNPMYGSWEAAMSGSGSPCEQLNRRVEALRP